MNPNEFGLCSNTWEHLLYVDILLHPTPILHYFGKNFQRKWKKPTIMVDFEWLVFCLEYGFSKKNPIFADKTSYFQVGTLKYIDVFHKCSYQLLKLQYDRTRTCGLGLDVRALTTELRILINWLHCNAINRANDTWRIIAVMRNNSNVIEPTAGVEPVTCWVQISCSANWAKLA